MHLHIQSFGFHRSGIPDDPAGHGGFVFDCRGLRNPGREDRFKDRNGLQDDVRAFLADESAAGEFLEHCVALIVGTAEAHELRGFDNLYAAFGCTGGQHRSVYCAEEAARRLRESGYDVTVEHREKDRWP